MPYANSSEALPGATSAARRASQALAWTAGIALILNALLTSPPRFSQAHHEDSSLLKTVVAALALVGPSAESGAFPTRRLVDIRSLIFALGAAGLCLTGGARLLTARATLRLTAADAWDIRERAKSPLFWWGVLLAVSALTSYFSHAPDISMGQVAVRFMHAAWWWPLAVLLLASHVRALGAALVLAMTLSSSIGLWYLSGRSAPGWLGELLALHLPAARMEYPIGNSLWFGACILPVVFVALGIAWDTYAKIAQPMKQPSGADSTSDNVTSSGDPSAPLPERNRLIGILCIAALPLLVVALLLTQARSSAWVGFAGGVFCVAFLAASKKARMPVLLAGLIIALMGVFWVQGLRATGVMGERAHSIRTRLNHEWPYAINLFSEKPVGGHGEGCYTMLAPQLARIDQLREPSVLSFSEQWWYSHAHNEYLELLADLGMIGAASFVLALVLTLYYAMRYCDRAASTPRARPYRPLAICLSAALFGMMLEECSSVALRNPGFPPIFLTVWALLWAVIRDERALTDQPGDAAEQAAIPGGVLRGAGLLGITAAIVLGYLGVQNWRGLLAREASQRKLEAGQIAAGLPTADFAARHLLDPFDRLSARMHAVRLRSIEFAQALEARPVPTDTDLQIAIEAFMQLDRLNRAAPRFLNVSRLAAVLSANMSTAYHRRGDMQKFNDYLVAYRAALVQASSDDPFDTGLVEQLWHSFPDAAPMERLFWLKRLLRRGEIDDTTRAMTETLFSRIPGAGAALNELYNVAVADAERSMSSSWQDELSPETLRIAAMIKDWTGQPAESERLARQAAAMYKLAGEGLFAARSAAIRESAFYGLHVDPVGRTNELLAALVEAHEIMDGPLNEKGEPALAVPLPREKGETRALVLAAAGREEALRDQLETLSKFPRPTGQAPTMAKVYADLAEQFSPKPQFADRAMAWAERARELNDSLPGVHYTLIGLNLARGDDKDAEEAARRFVELMPNRDAAYELLQDRERRWPASPMWARLRATFDDYPELPLEMSRSEPATAPTSDSAPASQPMDGVQSDDAKDGPPE